MPKNVSLQEESWSLKKYFQEGKVFLKCKSYWNVLPFKHQCTLKRIKWKLRMKKKMKKNNKETIIQILSLTLNYFVNLYVKAGTEVH